jgi:hypothetical protein
MSQLTEISQLQNTHVIQQAVLGLNVSMNDALQGVRYVVVFLYW